MASPRTRICKHLSPSALLGVLALCAGCPDGKATTTDSESTGPGTTGSSTTTGEPETTTGEPTTPTTGPDTTSGTLGETGSTTEAPGTSSTTDETTGETTTGTTGPDATTSAETTAGETTSADTTGTTGDPSEIESSCMAACEVLIGCDAFPDPPMCQEACVMGSMGPPACEAAAVAFNNCIAGVDCAALMMAGLGGCQDELDAYNMACEGI